VDSHVTNLRRKLGSRDGRRYVATVHGLGYRLVLPDDE
jgi:DNA-binding response OmpR family regulator